MPQPWGRMQAAAEHQLQIPNSSFPYKLLLPPDLSVGGKDRSLRAVMELWGPTMSLALPLHCFSS